MKLCYCCNNNDLNNKYINIKKDTKEIVLLTDFNYNVGVLGLENYALAMNNQALKVLNDMLLNDNVSNLNKIVTDYNDADNWIYTLVNDSVFEITDKPPKKNIICEYGIKKGEVINPNSSTKLLKAEYDGIVKEIQIDNTKVYLFKSKEDIDEQIEEDIASVLINKENEQKNLYPNANFNIKPKKTLTRNSGCTGCIACSACTGCVLCAEINFGAAAAAATGAAYIVHVN